MFATDQGKQSGSTGRRRFRKMVTGLAVGLTGIAVPLAAVTLVPTTASAATNTFVPPSPEPPPPECVQQVFSIANEGTSLSCVADEQVLLNNVIHSGLAADGQYGPLTRAAVRTFQTDQHLWVDGITGPQTWGSLCAVNLDSGFHGPFWKGAGCPTLGLG